MHCVPSGKCLVAGNFTIRQERKGGDDPVTRILCILSSLDAGGAETFIMKIARSLPADEYQIDFLVSKDGGCYTEEVLSRGGYVHKIPERHQDPMGAFMGIRKTVREHGYEYVLKLGTSPVAVLDLIFAKLGGAKRVCLRSCNAPTNVPLKNRCINAILRPLLNAVADEKIAPSMLAAEFTFGKKTAHKAAHLLNNGVDLSVFHYDEAGRKKIRTEFGLENKLVVGHIGRFFPQKNHPYLLKIFSAIHKINPNAVLLLVGTGKQESDVRALVKELKLEQNVIFAGLRFDIPQVLSAMDVFVFPSLHEGMPNTVIEAQATGLPCVIADTITEDADITGLVQYLPLSKTPEDWAQAALEAVSDERKDTAPAFISSGYDIQSVSRKFIKLICNL